MSSPALTYAPPSRESIYAALFALVSAPTVFQTKSRRLQSWSQVAAEEKPALYQIQVGEDPRGDETGKPWKWRLEVELYIFVAPTDDTAAVSPLLNPLVDAVVAALQPAVTAEVQTLGDLVYNTRLSGRIEYREGLLGPNAFAVIPIEIFTGDLQPD